MQNNILDFIGYLSSAYLLNIQRGWAVSTRSKFPWIFQRLADVNSSCKAAIKRRFSVQETPKASTHHPAEEKDVSCLGFSTMVSARTLLLAFTCSCAYLWLTGAEDSSLETRSLDFPLKTQQEKELVRDVDVGLMGLQCVRLYYTCIQSVGFRHLYFIQYNNCFLYNWTVLPSLTADWRFTRSPGEAEKQRDAFREKAWLVAVGTYTKFELT